MGNNTTLERTYELTEYLRRYPHLTSRWLGALLQTEQYHLRILGKLKDEGRVAVTEEHFGKEWDWHLTPDGLLFNDDRGYDFVPSTGWRDHQRASSFTAASFELGAREAGLVYLKPSHILMDYHCPDATRDNPKPWQIGEGKEAWKPDAPMFGLRGKRELYFFGFEQDRSSEGPDTIKGKLKNYQNFLDEKLYQKLYGLKDPPYFPWIVKHVDRIPAIKKAIEKVIQSDDRHRFIIRVQPYTVNFPPPNGHMLTHEWQTTDGLFNIMEYLNAGRKETSSHSGAEADPR